MHCFSFDIETIPDVEFGRRFWELDGLSDKDVATAIRDFVFQRFPLAKDLNPGDEDSLLEAGIIDSLGILDIVTFLEESLGVTAEDEDLSPENFDSIAALARFAESKRS